MAFNGKDAIEKVKKIQRNGSQYGLIITDCSMPIMDGYEATTKIREYCEQNMMKQPYIVACTEQMEGTFVRKAWINKIDEVISKPIKI